MNSREISSVCSIAVGTNIVLALLHSEERVSCLLTIPRGTP